MIIKILARILYVVTLAFSLLLIFGFCAWGALSGEPLEEVNDSLSNLVRAYIGSVGRDYID